MTPEYIAMAICAICILAVLVTSLWQPVFRWVVVFAVMAAMVLNTLFWSIWFIVASEILASLRFYGECQRKVKVWLPK